MSTRYRALILNPPGSRGVQSFFHGFKAVGFEPEVMSLPQLIESKIDHDQLCLKYKLVVLPSGQHYESVPMTGRLLTLQIQRALKWDLGRFAERGGLVLGTGTSCLTLNDLGVFGDDFSFRTNEKSEYIERWVRFQPNGNRCVWLKGLGLLDLPLNMKETVFVINPFAYVEAKGRLERLGLNCLLVDPAQVTGSESVMGLCDSTGRIFGSLPNPEYFLSWTNTEDWLSNPTRAAAPGQGYAIFENALKAAQDS